MPYLSDAELRAELAQSSPLEEAPGDIALTSSIVPAIGGMGTAAAMGFLRSKFEDPLTGEWNIPGTKWDAEAVAFLALVGLAFGGQYVGLGPYRSYAALGAIGIGCHFAGEVGRGFGKTGQLHLRVGGNGGVPPWDPTSFDPTQHYAPHDDDAAKGLASSGV